MRFVVQAGAPTFRPVLTVKETGEVIAHLGCPPADIDRAIRTAIVQILWLRR